MLKIVNERTRSYNSTISGPSGNITVNGTLTYGAGSSGVFKRGLGATNETGIDINTPPYAIHNGKVPQFRNERILFTSSRLW